MTDSQNAGDVSATRARMPRSAPSMDAGSLGVSEGNEQRAGLPGSREVGCSRILSEPRAMAARVAKSVR
jgi:hypothetical protein